MKTLFCLLLLLTSKLCANTIEYGVASYYSSKTGSVTASGARLSDYKLTAAHKTLKFGTLVKVTNLKNNKTVIVKINDRGPHIRGRIIDLTKEGARRLGFLKNGLTKVKIQVINHQ